MNSLGYCTSGKYQSGRWMSDCSSSSSAISDDDPTSKPFLDLQPQCAKDYYQIPSDKLPSTTDKLPINTQKPSQSQKYASYALSVIISSVIVMFYYW
jgi:hypothetical protein